MKQETGNREQGTAAFSRRAAVGVTRGAIRAGGGCELLGGNRELEAILALNKSKSERFRQLAFQRARVLAQTDVKDYRVIINKMHILEAEVIERMHLDDNLKGERSKLSKNDDVKGDVLIFPYTQEVWMDELDNYQARVKDCPTLKGASL